MQTIDKTKTIIFLIKIQDNAMDMLINKVLSEDEKKRTLYKIHYLDSVFMEICGITYNKQDFYRKNVVIYNHLEILKNLTFFQQTLFTTMENQMLLRKKRITIDEKRYKDKFIYLK